MISYYNSTVMHLAKPNGKTIKLDIVTLTDDEQSEMKQLQTDMALVRNAIETKKKLIVETNEQLNQLIGSQTTFQLILDRKMQFFAKQYKIEGNFEIDPETWTIKVAGE